MLPSPQTGGLCAQRAAAGHQEPRPSSDRSVLLSGPATDAPDNRLPADPCYSIFQKSAGNPQSWKNRCSARHEGVGWSSKPVDDCTERAAALTDHG